MKEKIKDILSRIGVVLMTLIADVAVAFSLYYIIKTPDILWAWCLVVLLVTSPILYIFNKYSIIGIKELFHRKI